VIRGADLNASIGNRTNTDDHYGGEEEDDNTSQLGMLIGPCGNPKPTIKVYNI
jgi:hypothetical protein